MESLPQKISQQALAKGFGGSAIKAMNGRRLLLIGT